MLLTEDLHSAMVFNGLVVRNPFENKIPEETPDYGNVALTVSRHRRRGRPARQPLE